MNTKNLIIILTLCFCFAALSGCGGPSEEEKAATADQAQERMEEIAADPASGAINPDYEGPPPEER